ncbi:MAG TPA: S8 family serine peptidase, partial [Gemmataceae bacterium]|nr:S8 family serine peptidase [Gemmataceae bacterium]
MPRDRTGGWEIEEALDVEWAHAVAPKANILLVEAFSNSNTNLYAAVDFARKAPGVVAVSMSWGGGEGSGETGLDSHFTTPSGHTGVTFLASSGDNGAPGGYPAMSPNVVAVGGTTLALDANDNRTSEVGWSGSGGGYSSVEGEPAYQSTYAQSSYVQNTLGNTVLLNSPRGNPDVALVADPNPGVAMYDTFPNSNRLSGWFAVGGTSDAAPQWAGLMALVDQGRGAAGSLDGA